MSDAYVECLVAAKRKPLMSFLKYLTISLTVVCGLLGLVGFYIIWFIAIALGVGAYFLSVYSNVEYEYLYLDKEIVVDKIFSQTRRKRFATYPLEKIEIIAPLKSWHLDSYKNRNFKEEDISSGVEKQPETRYVFYYNGEKKVIFEPDEDMVKILRNAAPRKVFVD
ncbi:MAG: DUF6106 family protein [Lachnospiraceae bacterium]|nr:DUF6106 family protein [Lachnospiraceae bacterium]